MVEILSVENFASLPANPAPIIAIVFFILTEYYTWLFLIKKRNRMPQNENRTALLSEVSI